MKPDRAAFEKWWSDNMNLQMMDLWRGHPSDEVEYYICHETQRSWLTWKAASEYVCSLVNDGKS